MPLWGPIKNREEIGLGEASYNPNLPDRSDLQTANPFAVLILNPVPRLAAFVRLAEWGF